MAYEVGGFVKRNNRNMIYPTINTDQDAKYIANGNEYEIIKKITVAIGNVFTLNSVRTSVKYNVSITDMNDFFENIDKPEYVEPKPVIKSETPTMPCKCDSLDLFRYGCKCGSVSNSLDLKYNNMLKTLLGPEKR